eukprot:1394793-Amorphochlora_amoeboformis.AAC.1
MSIHPKVDRIISSVFGAWKAELKVRKSKAKASGSDSKQDAKSTDNKSSMQKHIDRLQSLSVGMVGPHFNIRNPMCSRLQSICSVFACTWLECLGCLVISGGRVGLTNPKPNPNTNTNILTLRRIYATRWFRTFSGKSYEATHARGGLDDDW